MTKTFGTFETVKRRAQHVEKAKRMETLSEMGEGGCPACQRSRSVYDAARETGDGAGPTAAQVRRDDDGRVCELGERGRSGTARFR